MTPEEMKAARKRLGLSTSELATLLRLGANGSVTVRRWEAGMRDISGPVQVAMAALLDGWRPREGKRT